jgi:hypothetical protein
MLWWQVISVIVTAAGALVLALNGVATLLNSVHAIWARIDERREKAAAAEKTAQVERDLASIVEELNTLNARSRAEGRSIFGAELELEHADRHEAVQLGVDRGILHRAAHLGRVLVSLKRSLTKQ